MKQTAWGNAILEFGTPGAGDTMSATLTKIGEILEETLGIEVEDGTELSLFEEGHILRDMLRQEGTVRINGTIIGIPDVVMAEFWDVESATGKTNVKSMVSGQKYSVKISVPGQLGSDTLEVPYTSVKLGMAYASNQGWTAPFTFTIMKGATDVLFSFGVVE